MKKKIQIAIIFVIIVLAALLGTLLSKGRLHRCEHDGYRIQPIYEVELSFDEGSTRLCCVVCSLLYLKSQNRKPKAVTVVDEVSGQKIDASLASFVKSDVLTVPHAKNDIHVFASEDDAKRHATQYHGKLISNPFR